MTAVKSFKPNASSKGVMERRQAWLKADGLAFIIFGIYGRDGQIEYTVTIRKSDLETKCTCEYAKWRRDEEEESCWHMRKAMHSYLLRIQRGEVS